MTRPLCIAHGGDVSSPSGGTDRVTAIASGLAERGRSVHLVVPEPESALPERLADVTVHTVDTDSVLPGAIGRANAVASTAQRVADETGADLQVEHSTLGGIVTLRGTSEFVLDMHDLAYARFDHVETRGAPVLKRGVRWLERRAVEKASQIVVVSEYMREVLVDRWGVDPTSITVVPNGYFPERIERFRDTATVEGRVCFLGTLHPKVNVNAFERIADLDTVSELVVVGDGAQREKIEALADAHETVRATGRLPDDEAFELLGSAAVAVNPQHPSELQRSSAPVKLYTYAALGLPMVVASGPSVVEKLVDQDAAVTADDSQAVADAVEGLLRDDERRETLAANAREAATAFRWSRRIDTLPGIYGKVSRTHP